MKFVLVIASLFTLGFTLVSGGAITARSSLSSCGDGGEVLATNNFEHNGNSIGFVSGTCPQATANSTKRDTIEERQNVCTKGDCSLYCQNESKYTIYPSDCAAVIEYLEEQPSVFAVSGQAYHAWNYGSCTYYFVNFDVTTYTVCYSTFAYDCYATGSACLGGKTNGGTCTGSQAYGQKFQIIMGSEDTVSYSSY